MDIRFEFAAGPRILRAVFEGRLDDASLRHAYRELKRYVRATDPAVGIWDLSGVTEFEVTSDTVRDLGRSQPAFAPVSAPRFIVASSDLAYGSARMFQSIGDESRPHLHVVRSVEDVYARLKIAPPKYEPVAPPTD
jgi:hypothetical protein